MEAGQNGIGLEIPSWAGQTPRGPVQPMVMVPAAQFSAVTSALVDGLTIDGKDHKQWCLAQALRILDPTEYAEARASWGWDEGIAP